MTTTELEAQQAANADDFDLFDPAYVFPAMVHRVGQFYGVRAEHRAERADQDDLDRAEHRYREALKSLTAAALNLYPETARPAERERGYNDAVIGSDPWRVIGSLVWRAHSLHLGGPGGQIQLPSTLTRLWEVLNH